MEIKRIKGAIPYQYKKGEYIFRQGELLNHVYYLTKGKCYRMVLKENGEENIYTYWEQSDYLGAFGIIYGREYSENNIIAMTDCEGYKIPKEVFLKTIDKHPDILKQLLIRAVEELNVFKTNHQSLQEGKVSNRLCQLMLNQAKCKNGEYVIGKEFSGTQMAKYLGVHQVTISRILKALKEEGVIEKKKGVIYLRNYEQIQRFAEGEKIYYE